MNSAFLKDIFPNQTNFVIRPYVSLRGQRNGYKWTPIVSGHWTSFMNVEKKHYTLKNTGISYF